jgi:hypothetical protein
MECTKDIDINNLSRDFRNMRRDILWAVCPHCEVNFLPKIGVHLGNELNKYNKLQYDTSSHESVVLYSPFYLKYNINNGLIREFGNTLEIEDFKKRFNAIFWNSIWYFKVRNLDYEFMLPYEYSPSLNTFSHINDHIEISNVPVVMSKYTETIQVINYEKTKTDRKINRNKKIKKVSDNDLHTFEELKYERSASKVFNDVFIVRDQVNEIEILASLLKNINNENQMVYLGEDKKDTVHIILEEDILESSNFLIPSLADKPTNVSDTSPVARNEIAESDIMIINSAEGELIYSEEIITIPENNEEISSFVQRDAQFINTDDIPQLQKLRAKHFKTDSFIKYTFSDDFVYKGVFESSDLTDKKSK